MTLQDLRNYVSRNNACLDHELTLEIRFGLLNRIAEITSGDICAVDSDSVRILLKYAGVLIAESLIRDLEINDKV